MMYQLCAGRIFLLIFLFEIFNHLFVSFMYNPGHRHTTHTYRARRRVMRLRLSRVSSPLMMDVNHIIRVRAWRNVLGQRRAAVGLVVKVGGCGGRKRYPFLFFLRYMRPGPPVIRALQSSLMSWFCSGRLSDEMRRDAKG